MRFLHYVNKGSWPRGVWDNEPDKVQWIDPETDLDCLIVRHPRSGHLCGYVGVPETHNLFEVNYDNTNLDAHGGLTFSDVCCETDKDHGICHVPENGRPDLIWWFGFDCAHLGDLSPANDRMGFGVVPDRYRDMDYVKSECSKLAKQIKELA